MKHIPEIKAIAEALYLSETPEGIANYIAAVTLLQGIENARAIAGDTVKEV